MRAPSAMCGSYAASLARASSIPARRSYVSPPIRITIRGEFWRFSFTPARSISRRSSQDSDTVEGAGFDSGSCVSEPLLIVVEGGVGMVEGVCLMADTDGQPARCQFVRLEPEPLRDEREIAPLRAMRPLAGS